MAGSATGRQEPKPSGVCTKKSDMAIVARKRANKTAGAEAESVERRAMTERNPRGQNAGRTQSRGVVNSASERIRQYVKRNPKGKLTTLLHYITPQALEGAYHALKQDVAPGEDAVTWREYGEGLEERICSLHRRVHTGGYRATPSRRVNIPKPDGGTRPLGIVGRVGRDGSRWGASR